MVVASTEKVTSFFKGSELRKYIKSRGKVRQIICHPRRDRGKDSVCFLLTENKIIFKTQSQAFVLEAVEIPGNLWERRLHKIRRLIQERKIKSRDDLLHECGRGVRLVAVGLGWYV